MLNKHLWSDAFAVTKLRVFSVIQAEIDICLYNARHVYYELIR